MTAPPTPAPTAVVPTVVVFADLDDTLFQTRRKLRGDEGDLTPATVDRHGEPHSFQTPAQVALLHLLVQGGATIVPVTGRDPAAMGRVTLPLTSWQVIDHGATILEPGGAVHQPWADHVAPQLRALEAQLRHAHGSAAPLARSLGCRLTVHHAHGAGLMVVAKHPDADPGALAGVQEHWAALTHGTALHVIANANNVTVMPRAPGKAGAVAYLREHAFAGATLTLGLGDSVSDLGFMAACTFAVTPAAGQLMRALADAELPQR